jgi:hypothetical protein
MGKNLAKKADPRRKFPRKDYHRGVGFLFNGDYLLLEGSELGEGGLSFFSPRLFPIGEEAVLTFQVPDGSFISVRAEVRHTSTVVENEQFLVGCLFKNLQFEHKREIRFYVSKQSDNLLKFQRLN